MKNGIHETTHAPMGTNFIHNIIEEELESGKVTQVHTRFPPEPNGYLHIGHAKAILISYLTAQKYDGKFNLRFDDTNPVKEDVEYVNAIKEDIKWLGCQWDGLFYASDYFEDMYNYAVELIEKGLAYVDDQSADQIRETRGTLTQAGVESPFRNRSVEENLDLFKRMRSGEFPDGTRVLRAKIDMTSSNINMRDPVIYRIAHARHHNTGDQWCIYPMYDYAHPIEDALEGITHSLCSLEFENHRPLYDWVLMNLDDYASARPRQIEFAKLYIKDSVLGKRYLKKLVDDGQVEGWDDPRLDTISGMRRRGITPEAIRDFAERIGVSKSNSMVDRDLLDHCVREDLKPKALRRMAVLDPLKVVITNYPEGQEEWLEDDNNTDADHAGTRQIPFGREIYVERSDFELDPPKNFHRLYPGNEVRLRKAYFIKCNEVVQDDSGKVLELRCTYDPETKSGSGFNARKVKGTIHWVSVDHAVDATVRLYDTLIVPSQADESQDQDQGQGQERILNPESKIVLTQCKVEPAFKEDLHVTHYQFLRHGYFVVDSKLSSDENLVFNRIVSLKSSYKG